MELRPCIDLHEGRVKQIVGSTLGKDNKAIENYVSDEPPAYYAHLFKRDGLKGGHVIMLGPGNEEAAVEALQTYPQGFQVGGGIDDTNAMDYIKQGASHVIVTSFLFRDGMLCMENLEKLKKRIGRKRIVIDVSCRKKNGKFTVVADRWQTFTDLAVTEQSLKMIQSHADELLVHGVDVEGKKAGISEELVALFAENTDIPVTYAGGIRSIDDLLRIKTIGRNRIHVTIGSALDLFGGPLSYEKTVAWFREQANNS